MAAVYSKELLGWYLITLKLRQTLESRLPKKSTIELRPPESEWVISIKEKVEQGRQDNVRGSRAKLAIYRIPRHLKNGEEKDWVPQVVSLGPYHHGEEHLLHMERHKWRCLHRILERSHQEIGRYLDSVKKVEGRARACYEGTISMSSDKFVEMMVLDGCFVIELFRGFGEGFTGLGYPRDDPVFSMQESLLQIQRDMFMLENQIPLFILDWLLGLQLGHPNQKGCVAKLAIKFFSPLIDLWLLEFDPLFGHDGFHHCLDVFVQSLQFLDTKRSKTKRWSVNTIKECLRTPPRLTSSLTKLREAGIKIKHRYGKGMGNIKFKDGILRIPSLMIHGGMRSLFLNLIAFEQSHLDCSNYVTSYVIFMHNLINSPKDVQYLRDLKIIDHGLGSDAEVVDLFNRLYQEVAFVIYDSYLCQLSSDLELYCTYGSNLEDFDPFTVIAPFTITFRFCVSYLASKRRAWIAILKEKYFDSPWSIISLIAAFILLVLTFIQALYAVYGYYRPRS